MRRPAKIALWLLGIVVFLVVVAAVGIRLYLTKERILAWVIPPLEERLQRQVTIADAGAGLTGISLEGLDIRAEGAAEPLVAAQEIRIRWDLWALLGGTVKVDEVRLVEPQIRVVRLPDGTLDIADLLEAPEEAPPAQEPPAEPGEGPPVEIVVALFSLQDGRAAFEDRAAKPPQTYALEDIDSRVTDLALDRPIQYELSAKLPLAPAGRFSARGKANPATGDVTAKVTVDSFELASLNPVLEGGMRFASGELNVDLDAQVQGGERAQLGGTTEIRGLALASDQGTGEKTDVSVLLEAAAELAKDTAELRKVDISAAGQTLHVEAKAKGLAARPRVEFQVTSPELRVEALTGLLPPGDEAPPAPEEPAKPPAPSPPASIPLDAYGDVKVGRLLASGLAVEEFSAHLELEKGVLSIDPATASIYGGTLEADLRSELERQGPPFETKVSLDGTQLGELLAGLSPKLEKTATGSLNLSVDAQGVGGDLAALQSHVVAEAKDGKLINHPLVMRFAQLFKVKELETLNFYNVKADLQTAEGEGTLNSFVFRGPNLQATGTGTVGLVDQDLDLRLAVAVPQKIAEKVVPGASTLKAMTDEEGWTRLPLNLKGSLQDPAYGLDAEGLKAAAAKALGGKAEKALEEKVLKKVPGTEEQKGAVEKGLKKLLGQ